MQEQKRMKRDLDEETKARKRLETNLRKFMKTRTDIMDESLMWSQLLIVLSQLIKGPITLIWRAFNITCANPFYLRPEHFVILLILLCILYFYISSLHKWHTHSMSGWYVRITLSVIIVIRTDVSSFGILEYFKPFC